MTAVSYLSFREWVSLFILWMFRQLTVHGRVNDEYGDYPSLDNVADSICYQNGSPTFRLWE